MPKIPDFSELTKKLDLQNIVDSVKAAIGQNPVPNKAPEGDKVAERFIEINQLIQDYAKVHAEQAKAIANISNKLGNLYRDLQAMEKIPTATTEAEKTAAEKTHSADNK